MHLETAYTGHCTLRCTYFGREIGEGSQVNAQQGCIVGKLLAGKLHTIATVSCKFYHYILQQYFFCVHIQTIEVMRFRKRAEKHIYRKGNISGNGMVLIFGKDEQARREYP
jgi:hypothetical protein